MKYSLKTPVPELFVAAERMQQAVTAHLSGDADTAADRFRAADIPALWDWLYPEWERCHLNVIERAPAGDTVTVPKGERDPVRTIPKDVQIRLLERDGYRCRYCCIPVVHPDIRKIAHRLYPKAVPWDSNRPQDCHQGFQSLWLQFDHVVPHSHGGASDEANSVVSCALCNFGKDKYTLLELGLIDPRDRDPILDDWGGLEELRSAAQAMTWAKATPAANRERRPAGDQVWFTFFFAGAWISSNYVYTPPLAGKPRWFQISESLSAEPEHRNGVEGCLVRCDPQKLVRRGLDPAVYRVD